MTQEFEQIGINAGNVISHAGAGTMVISGLTLSDWGIVVGIVCWAIGTALAAFFNWRRHEREKLEMLQRIRYRNRALRAMQTGKWVTWQDPIDAVDVIEDITDVAQHMESGHDQ